MTPCLGPCGREVVSVNSDGLCAKCQQERAKERLPAEAAVNRRRRGPGKKTDMSGSTNPGPDEIAMCKRGCGQRRHRGNCRKPPDGGLAKPRRAYVRRAAAREPAKTGGVLERLTTLRAGIQEEHDLVEHALAVLRVKLETYDEILGVLG